MLKPLVPMFRPDLSARLRDIAEKQVTAKPKASEILKPETKQKGAGAEVCGGPGITPSKIKNSPDLGNYSLRGAPFCKRKKIEKQIRKSSMGPHPDSYRGHSDFQI